MTRLASPAPARAEAPAPTEPEEPHPALEQLAALDPDALSPRQALETLFALKALLK